jgi:hypothetical protein
MRSIAISSVGSAIFFLVVGIGSLAWWYGFEHRPLLKPHSTQEIEFVRTTSDLEHLRAYTQLLIRKDQEVSQKTNDLIDSLMSAIAGLSIFCSMFSGLGWAYARKAYLVGSGSPLPIWLRWI